MTTIFFILTVSALLWWTCLPILEPENWTLVPYLKFLKNEIKRFIEEFFKLIINLLFCSCDFFREFILLIWFCSEYWTQLNSCGGLFSRLSLAHAHGRRIRRWQKKPIILCCVRWKVKAALKWLARKVTYILFYNL